MRFPTVKGVSFDVTCRAKQLWEPWRNCILAELLFYTDSGFVNSVHLEKAQSLLKKDEPLERCSLLELAVWNTCWISRAREEPVDPSHCKTVADAIRLIEGQRDSWKDFRKEMSSANAIWIVITHVLPFIVGNT